MKVKLQDKANLSKSLHSTSIINNLAEFCS